MHTLYEVIHSVWILWVMLIFIGIVAWAYWPKHKAKMEEHGRIPLRDDENEER